ncbi:MAG: response regulator [Gammaproteobacteria bacterium]|nr:response regulator [Gammaproteobacteria bacterium]
MPIKWFEKWIPHGNELQSAIVRLTIWFFSALYIGLGDASSYYVVDKAAYNVLFGGYLLIYLAILVSVLVWPDWKFRRYISLVLDILAVSLTIYLTQDVVSPFYLLYIWIFVSYGTRYGKRHLMVASVFSVVSYATMVALLGQWSRYSFEAVFFLLLLMLLPLYQYSLLRRLHKVKQEAERANQAKSRFLSTMTHELRTPLSGITGMTRLLTSTSLTQNQQDYVDSIAASAGLLNSLIGDVLDLSKIEAERLDLEHRSFDLRSAVYSVCVTLSDHALDKGVELICRIDREVPARVLGDELRVKQILFNLVGNAVKFTERGEVDVHLKLEGESEDPCLMFLVRDTGPGISDEMAGHLFDRFWQADSSATASQGGAGLGTNIARSLARLMGGEVGFQRVGGGAGSLFSFRLPMLLDQNQPDLSETGESKVFQALLFETNETSLQALQSACEELGVEGAAVGSVGALSGVIEQVSQLDELSCAIIADAPEAIDVTRIADIIRDHIRSDLPVLYLGYRGRSLGEDDEHAGMLPKPFISEQLGRALSLVMGEQRDMAAIQLPALDNKDIFGRLRVMVAEDNLINGKVLTTLLTDLGCKVTWVKDGVEALNVAYKNRFDLALVDLRMPRMSGVGFVQGYRAQEHDGHYLPIIALSASLEEPVREECRKAGMDEVLQKPVDSVEVEALILKYAAKTAMRKAAHSRAVGYLYS